VIKGASNGEFIITWVGEDDDGSDYSVYVQKFNTDGSLNSTPTKLEATYNTTGWDKDPQITLLGDDGRFAVSWSGVDGDISDYSIFVQVFNADGTTNGDAVMLEAIDNTYNTDNSSQIIDINDEGSFVVTWKGIGSIYQKTNIYLQKFNADGSLNGMTAELKTFNWSNHVEPQIITLGTDGDFLITWSALRSAVYALKFNADGMAIGTPLLLSATGLDTNNHAQVTSVGNNGDFVITSTGREEQLTYTYDNGIYGPDFNYKTGIIVQKFSDTPVSNSDNFIVQSSEAGTAYVVHETVIVNSLEDITNADDNLWNSINITEAFTDTILSASGLLEGNYVLYSTDLNANFSDVSDSSITVIESIETSVVVFDLVGRQGSEHSGRSFQSDIDYTIYIRVNADHEHLNVVTEWTNASNLGAGDKIVLVGDGAVIGQGSGVIDGTNANSNNVNWTTVDANLNAVQLDNEGNLDRFFQSNSDNRDIWTGTANFSLMSFSYATEIPAGVLTSQGLV
jgi:hypothetical protein